MGIEKKTGNVSPFYYTLLEAVDNYGNPLIVNNKGENIEFKFNKNSNKFCFKGDAYRNADFYDPRINPEFCFVWDENNKELVRDLKIGTF